MILLGGTALLVGFFFFVVSMVFGMLKGSENCKFSYYQAIHNEEVVQILGEPLELGFWLKGSIHLTNGDGIAQMEIPIHGSVGEGKMYLEATKKEGEWSYDLLDLYIVGVNEPMDLLPKTDAELQAFKAEYEAYRYAQEPN